MLQRARESGPALLVPLAWTFVTAAHLGLVDEHVLFVAHVVMSVLLAVFAITGRADMREGVLERWWQIIAVGFVVTVCGTVGFQVDAASEMLWAVAVLGWILLPAAGFAVTARAVPTGAWIYTAGAVGCVLGAVLYVAGLGFAPGSATVAGLALVGVGQTAGILDATLRY